MDDQARLELLTLYLKNMQRIKWRQNAIAEIRSKKRTTSYEHTNIEFSVLQIRKVLELIAFSSLISDADIYKEKLGNIERMWNAELIFKDIERIHPDFYPQAIINDPNDKDKWLDSPKPGLTKELFIHVYNKCGKYLHEASPFLTEKQIYDDYSILREDICRWNQLITDLLNTHIIQLYNQKELFFISMGANNDSPEGNLLRRN